MLQVLCNVHRAASEWRTDYWNYDKAYLYTMEGFGIMYTPVRFI